MDTQHKLLMEGPPGYLSRWTCRCSCGKWEGKVPDAGPFGRTTAKARIAQVEMAHGKHAKYARAAMLKASASQTSRKAMSNLGYWREPLSVPEGAALTWQAPGSLGLQVWIGTLAGKPVARISRQPGHGNGCSAALNGWMWTKHLPGSGAALLGVKESPMRGFGSVPEAKRAIEAALAVD